MAQSLQGAELTLPQQQYVETIAELVRADGAARLSRLAARLQVRLPSASEAVARLVRGGMAVRRSRFEIGLTPAGQRLAGRLDRRHRALRRFMVEILGMGGGEADRLACRVEHWVGPAFADRLLRLADVLERQPATMRKLAGRRSARARTGRPGARRKGR